MVPAAEGSAPGTLGGGVMATEVVPQLTAEMLATIDELVTEGRALEVEVADYAKRVKEVTTTVLGIADAFPDRNSDPLFAWTGYDDLGRVVEDLRSLLEDAIDDPPPGDARWLTKEAKSA